MTDATTTQPTPPTIPAPAGDTPADRLDIFTRALSRAAPAWLPRRRWFGDKTRAISGVSLRDGAVARVGPDPIGLLLVEIAFADRGAATYFIPLAQTATEVPSEAILATIASDHGDRLVVDALALPAARAWILDRLAAGDRHPEAGGELVWQPAAGLRDHLDAARAGESRVSGAEQSNSTIVYGSSMLLKVFRKLQPGLNPDIEIGRFLAERTSFRHAPALLGDLAHVPTDAQTSEISLAMAQPFVNSLGDGWSVLLDRLAAILAGESVDLALDLATRLGQRTAQLHLALASDNSDPAFAPQPITSDDARRWSTDLAAALSRTLASLQAHPDRLPDALRDRVLALAPDAPTFDQRRQGFATLIGAAKTRVHGDYHLGQTLVTPEGDVVILDFEGEPARPLAERRQLTSPLKDIAGMLRSFGYARASARAKSDTRPPADIEKTLLDWEHNARTAFLDAYLAETRANAAPFLPPSPAAFTIAIAAWELDKANYEVNYELNNRPDWLELPLSTLLDPYRSPQ